MAKIYMKDIKRLCNCIVGLSCQTIKNNKKGAFNKGYIYTYNIYPYGNCITFQFIENDHITFNSYSKKFMFEQLLRYYKKGLKVYTIKNKYLRECGLLNEKNVCNVLVKYKERKLKK